MLTYRNNKGRAQPVSTTEQRMASVERHHNPVAAPAVASQAGRLETSLISDAEGDVIYGARAIAQYLFNSDDNRTRRRVFNLWTHYRDRKEKAGFFKLKGALCLSKSEWRRFRDQ
jgi:hypothetical protein